MRRVNIGHLILLTVSILLTLTGCGLHKNTASARWWQAFNTRYNTYFNGSQAFNEGNLEKESGNKDNYTELLPLYTVGNKGSRELGKAQYDRTIEKCEKAIKLHSIKTRPVWNNQRRKTAKDREWLGRREYNPFLWKAWLLMGKAQFQKGDFDEAAATFSYMSRLYQTQPAVNGLARAWLAKCYIQLDWMYDAEDVIRNMRRDSIHYRAAKDWDYTLADYYIHTGQYQEAIPYLKKVIGHEMRRKQKAREWYLLGQIHAQAGHQNEAYQAFKKVVSLNPPYELAFNARIAQTEVMANGQSRKMINRLRQMARSDNNTEYQEQIYYAIGNIHLAEQDTARAIAAYEEGNRKATRHGIEKGVLLLTLGDLYWNREDYGNARRCYGEAIGLLDQDRKDYEALSLRSKILDELVPYTEAVHLQDSLQGLAQMDEADLNRVIDRLIAEERRRQREEERTRQEAETEESLQAQEAIGDRNQTASQMPGTQTGTTGQWYFYNPMAVSQGKTTFQRLWGKRENVDDWQRVNRTVVRLDDLSQQEDEQEPPAEETAAVHQQPDVDSIPHNDPLSREYYLAQIPFTEEQRIASDNIIMDGLLHAGIIFKDRLSNLPQSERYLTRLATQYPMYEKVDEAYYHLYLLYARQGDSVRADSMISCLQRDCPDSEWTTLLSDPHYAENARFGTHIEDSLYAATYEAFRLDRIEEVVANSRLSQERFPFGANRAKFLFIEGMTLLNDGDATQCLDRMKEVVEKYPQNEVTPLAGMIVKGVQEGRQLHGGKFDIGDLWSRRDVVRLAATDSTASDTLSNLREGKFVFMIVFHPDSLNGNQLLYDLAKYNFTNYLVRNFDIETDEDQGMRRMKVTGFLSYDEALQYARQLSGNQPLSNKLNNARRIIINEVNLNLLGSRFSYDDYDLFYQQTLAPVEISKEDLLTIPEEIAQPEVEEPDDKREPQETPVTEQSTKRTLDIEFDDDFFY